VNSRFLAGRAKSFLVSFTLAVVLLSICFPSIGIAQSKSGFTYNAIVHVSFQPSEYNSTAGTSSRNDLAATKASWASVLVTQYQANATATSISADSNRTPTDAAVIAAIQDLHSRGFKVFLKPHVDSEDGAWRGTFQPTSVATWFQSYTTFITHYAQLAAANGVEGMVMGTEFVQLSGSANRTSWINVINAIRNVYTGTLTYAANATFPADEFTTVSFWDHLDLLGLDAYFPLTNHADPTVAELVAAWSNNLNNQNPLAAVQNFASANGKPVIFTEIGYKSVPGANEAPFDFNRGNGGPADDAEQTNCTEALFEVWSQQTSFFQGLFWWAWPVQPDNVATDTDYNPRGKPVISTFQLWFGPAAGGDFSISPNPPNLTINQGASGTSTIAITRTGGFTGNISFTIGSLPNGVTASFNPNPASGNSSILTLSASPSAATGTLSIPISGTSGVLTHTTTLTLTVNPVQSPNFGISPNPASLTVSRGASGTSTITITRTGGFTASVSLSASGLPAGVTANFNPLSTTGTSSVLTLSASSAATIGTFPITITGSGGGLTKTATISLTVADGNNTGGVTVTPVVATQSNFFNEEQVKIANTGTITALTVTVVIQRTTGINFSGQYNTVGGQIAQSHTTATSTVTYTFTLNAGQTLSPGTNWIFAEQTSGTGTAHPTSGDTFTVAYTTGGQNFTQSGHF